MHHISEFCKLCLHKLSRGDDSDRSRELSVVEQLLLLLRSSSASLALFFLIRTGILRIRMDSLFRAILLTSGGKDLVLCSALHLMPSNH